MNPDLQKQLADMLAKLTDVAGAASSWAGQQIPPLVQEKIVYGRISSTCWVVLIAVAIWPVAVYTRRFYRQACADRASKEGYRSDIWPERPGGLASMLGAVLTVGLTVSFFINLNEALLVWFAPRLYVVEWLRGMVSK